MKSIRKTTNANQRVSMYVDSSNVRLADEHQEISIRLHPIPPAVADRRIHHASILGLRQTLPKQGKLPGSHRANQGMPSPGWGGSRLDDNRQAVRADVDLFGKSAKTARRSPTTIGAFLTPFRVQIVTLQGLRLEWSVTDPSLSAIRNSSQYALKVVCSVTDPSLSAIRN